MAMYYLTEQQVKLLQEILDAHRNTAVNGRNRQDTERSWDTGEDHQAPEVYIAKAVQAYGVSGTGVTVELLPGRTDPTVGTGTGDPDYSVPGLAKCAIYSVVDDDFGSPTLRPLGGDTPEEYCRWVYNVFPDNTTDFFPVARTKSGHWIMIGSQRQIVPAVLTGDLNSGSYANATLLEGSSRDVNGNTVEVHDIPTFITAGKKIASGTNIRIYYDPVVGQYVLLTVAACEVDQ